MRPTRKALATLALSLALGTATTAAGATPPTGPHHQADQRTRRPLDLTRLYPVAVRGRSGTPGLLV